MGRQDQRRTLRRHRPLPPPPPWLREHAVIPASRVAEVEEGVLFALVLALRDLAAWVDAPPEGRASRAGPRSAERTRALARAGTEFPPLAEALETISAARAAPGSVGPEALAAAGRRIYAWADERGLPEVAVLFAEAAARVDPESPALASDAGRAARHAAMPDRSEVWYERAAGLASRRDDRRELIRALLGRGALLRELGRYAEAKRLFERAAGLAASTRRHRQAGETHHELLIIAAETGTYAEAERHMRAALRHYPIHHPYFPVLVHDWSFLLIRNDLYEQALPLLEAVTLHVRRPGLQMLTWGSLARAAAGANRRARFDEASDRVSQLIQRSHEYAAAALANVAEGARFFGEWGMCEELAERALQIARSRQEIDVEQGAAAILKNVCARVPPPQQAETPAINNIDAITRRIHYYLNARMRPPRRPVEFDLEQSTSGRQGRPPAE